MMRCAHCGRKLFAPAYTAPVALGSWTLGPVCLERERAAGRLPPASRHEATRQQRRAPARKRGANVIPVRRVRVLPVQLDLFAPSEK